MTISPHDLTELWRDRQQKYRERDRIGQRLRDVLSNTYQEGWRDIVPAGQEPVVGNLIWAAARTIAQRVGRYPRIVVNPSKRDVDDSAAEKSEGHETQLSEDLDRFNFRAILQQACYWLVTHDLMPLIVRPSPFYGVPVIEVKDPLTCYPGTVWPHKPEVYDVLFAQRVPAYHAARLYPEVSKVLSRQTTRESVDTVVLAEFFDTSGVTVALLEPECVPIDYIPSILPGKITTFVSRGFSPDLDFHGQFDHVVPILIAQAKLTGLVMALAEQNVFAETNVFAELSSNQAKYAWGPNAVNFFTPGPGSRVEKSINNMSPQVFQELDRLERSIRIGGGFPGQLSGEPVATIATGKGIEELTVTVDDNVNYWQTVVQDVMTRALRCYSDMAKAMESDGADNYQANEKIKITIRHLASSDPSETVGLLQKIDSKLLSRTTVRQRLDEIEVPEREEVIIETEMLRDAILQGVAERAAAPPEAGGMSPGDIAKLIRMRRNGTPIEEAILDLEAEQASAPAGPPSMADLLGQSGQGAQPQPAMGLGQARQIERQMGQAPNVNTLSQGQGVAGPPALASGGANVPPL